MTMPLSLFCRRNCPFIAIGNIAIINRQARRRLCFCRVQNSLRVVGNHVPVEWIGQSVKGRACWPGTTCSMARTTDSCELYSWRRVRHTTARRCVLQCALTRPFCVRHALQHRGVVVRFTGDTKRGFGVYADRDFK